MKASLGKRVVFNLVGILSLILTVWLFVRWITPNNVVLFISDGRAVAASNLGDAPDAIKAMPRLLTQANNAWQWKVMGIEYVRDDWTADAFQLLAIPLPYFILVTGATAIFWLNWIRLNRRGRHGRCRNCNYDLRSTPDRCPECGITPQC